MSLELQDSLDPSRVDVAEPIAPETPAEVSSTVDPTPPAETSTPAFSFLQSAREAGFNVDQFESDEAAARAFFQYTRSLDQPPEPPPPPKQAEEEWTPESHFGKFWEVPKFDPSWDEILQMNPETGRIEAKPHVPWGQAQKAIEGYTNWQMARTKAMNGLFQSANPFQKIYEAVKPALEREFAKREQITEAISAQEENAAIVQFRDTHREWLGTDDGKRFIQFADKLNKVDKLPPLAAIERALEVFTPAQRQTVAQAVDALPETPQPKPETSFVDDALAKAGHRPGGAAPSTPPGHQSLDPEEVRNLFKREASRSKTAT